MSFDQKFRFVLTWSQIRCEHTLIRWEILVFSAEFDRNPVLQEHIDGVSPRIQELVRRTADEIIKEQKEELKIITARAGAHPGDASALANQGSLFYANRGKTDNSMQSSTRFILPHFNLQHGILFQSHNKVWKLGHWLAEVWWQLLGCIH